MIYYREVPVECHAPHKVSTFGRTVSDTIISDRTIYEYNGMKPECTAKLQCVQSTLRNKQDCNQIRVTHLFTVLYANHLYITNHTLERYSPLRVSILIVSP